MVEDRRTRIIAGKNNKRFNELWHIEPHFAWIKTHPRNAVTSQSSWQLPAFSHFSTVTKSLITRSDERCRQATTPAAATVYSSSSRSYSIVAKQLDQLLYGDRELTEFVTKQLMNRLHENVQKYRSCSRNKALGVQSTRTYFRIYYYYYYYYFIVMFQT